MVDKDLEAFEEWFKSNANSSFAVFLRENYPDLGIKWDREPARSSWISACEYMRSKANPLDALSLYEKLEREREENKKLREALEFYAEYKNDDPGDDYNHDVARETLKKVGDL